MSTSHFCPHCGAANAPTEVLCYACLQPLDVPGVHPQTPTLLGARYEILTELGTGGFGAVYKARDTQDQGRLVAVKQINLQGLSAQEIIEATDAFNREARILSSLNHPLLPRIFDRFSDPEHWYLVMTFIDGQTLDEYLQKHLARALPGHTGLALSETLDIGLQLCDVLHYLHTRLPPVIFRDLKPENIMRANSGRLYLIDFGIARHFKPGQARDTIPFGSPGFAAPEQYGRAQTTPQADIYSLGALLFYLASGDDPSEHPFSFPRLKIRGVSSLNDPNTLIQRMVALDPEQRPADMLEVRHALQRIAQQNRHGSIWTPPEGQTPPALPAITGGQPQTVGRQRSAARKTPRRRVLTGSLIAGGVLLTGGLGIYLGRPSPTRITVWESTVVPGPSPTVPAPDTLNTLPVPTNGITYWSQDLNYAAITNLDLNQIALYKIQGTQLIQTIALPAFFSNPVVQWSLDHSKILVTADEGIIKGWNVQNGQEFFTFTSMALRFTLRAVWSPDGQYCALSYLATNVEPYFGLLRMQDGKQLFQMSSPGVDETHNDSNMAWSPDSQHIALPGNANWPAGVPWTVKIWERQMFQQVSAFSGTLPASLGEIANISVINWSPDGKQLVAVVDNMLWLSQFGNQQSASFFARIPRDGIIYGPIWSPDQKYLAVLALLPPAVLTVWDTDTGQPIQVTGNAPQDNLAAFVWTADSKSIIAADSFNGLSTWTVE